ncbi:TetR/AcrR family transcriptional regulator C-terminal domain-containing protein [Streptosporangium saharense]|uniref:AcrR family transcriptional regulator n=1 Tax=Streptosporangium saharense TaxID=1706840 RepID=A0A7W7QTY2_9ACTN|nr:TetR/AcrR family transcriptional regulator C-terminal domain-containing protein [Streptosporangium saharense]MBB4919719.1 AcrR family transcriptional regulator [Streptosporangium saharense]
MAAEKNAFLWERLERPSPAPRQTLSPQRIATTAVAIADAEGLEAITMRRLATDLGVAPMAPYRHVSGKDDLLELMVDHVYADLRLPSGLGWRPSLRTLAVLTRELMLRHRWLAQLPPQAKLSLTPNRMTVAEQALAALDGLGLDADTMMSVFRAVDAYVHGAMSHESAVSTLVSEQSLSGGAELRDDLAPLMMWHMRTGRYPTFQDYLRTATRKDDAAWQFDLGLDCLLDGIATRLGI